MGAGRLDGAVVSMLGIMCRPDRLAFSAVKQANCSKHDAVLAHMQVITVALSHHYNPNAIHSPGIKIASVIGPALKRSCSVVVEKVV
ncbi:hypothetical protein MRB53_037574 [Persea americana]|nr:hypothetical protein MRB53_037574 [Persea americana]